MQIGKSHFIDTIIQAKRLKV